MQHEFFKDKKPDIKLLLAFGFLEQSGEYRYDVSIVDGQFNLVITLSVKNHPLLSVRRKHHDAFPVPISTYYDSISGSTAQVWQNCRALVAFK